MKRTLIQLLLALPVFAWGSNISPAFTFDSRYPASGITKEQISVAECQLSIAISSAFETDTRVANAGGGHSESNSVAIKISNQFVCDTGGLYYDWDGDGIPNWWEARFSRSKTDLDASSDMDGDGMTELAEFIAYTDPTNATSRFLVSIGPANTRSTGDLSITWNTVNGRTYSLYSTTSLTEGWNDEPMAVINGTGDSVSITIDQSASSQFFKVDVDLMEP